MVPTPPPTAPSKGASASASLGVYVADVDELRALVPLT
jgi:hypothetical protein